MLYTEMYQRVLDVSIQEWNQIAERFRSLDSKAQATATISGVFIAATFAFIKQLPIQKDWYVLAIVTINLFLLASSVVLSVLAMKIRTYRDMPGGEYMLVLIEDIQHAVENGQDVEKMEVGFLFEQATQWQQGTDALRIINRRKARIIEIAQWSLVTAILMVVVITIFSMFK